MIRSFIPKLGWLIGWFGLRCRVSLGASIGCFFVFIVFSHPFWTYTPEDGVGIADGALFVSCIPGLLYGLVGILLDTVHHSLKHPEESRKLNP